MEILTKKEARIIHFFEALNNALNSIESLLENYAPPLNGERYFTDKDLSQRLHISRRALQDYRSQGLISYIQFGGKILYRESDIEKMLERLHIKAWRESNL